MKKEWLVKTLALDIVVLFLGVSFQSIIAEKAKLNQKTVQTILLELAITKNEVKMKKIKK